MDSRFRGNDRKNKTKKKKRKSMGGTPTLHMGETPTLRGYPIRNPQSPIRNKTYAAWSFAGSFMLSISLRMRARFAVNVSVRPAMFLLASST